MSFEKELTVAILDQNENPMGYLDSNRVQVSETNELYNLRLLDIIHPLLDEFSNDSDVTRYDNLLIAGNKVWMPQSPTGDSCLYILHADKEYDFDETTITITATEAAIELSQNKVIRLNTTLTTTATNLTNFLNDYFYELFQVGTINGPTTTTVTLNGAFTPLEILRKIETGTGGEFKFRYEYESGQINRYIDFYNQIGDTHKPPIELEYNATEMDISISEENTRIAAAPTGEPSSDAASFHAAMAAFEALEFKTTTQIPLYISKDDAGNAVTGPLAYPPYPKPAGQGYLECNNINELVASYQNCQSSKASKAQMSSTIQDAFNDSSIDPNWLQYEPNGTWAETAALTYYIASTTTASSSAIWTTGTNYARLFYRTLPSFSSDWDAKVRVNYNSMAANIGKGLFLMTGVQTFIRLELINVAGTSQIRVTNVINGGSETTLATANLTNQQIWLRVKYVASTGIYYFQYSVAGTPGSFVTLYSTSSLGFVPSYVGLFGRNWSSSGTYNSITASFSNFILKPGRTVVNTSQPRIYTFDTTETNLYNLYWACVEKIRSYLQPEVTIDTTVVDIKKLQGATPEQYKTGDTVYIRLPNKTTVVGARITKTVKDPREPEKDGITISNYQTSLLKNMYKGYYKSAGTIDI